jgi:RAP domain
MFKVLVKKFAKALDSYNLKYLFFKSNLLTNRETVDTIVRASEFGTLDLRSKFGKDELFKNFFYTASQKIHLMKNEEILAIINALIKNPDFRDLRNTHYIWGSIFRSLLTRVDTLSLQQIIEITHATCFLRTNKVIAEQLLAILMQKFDKFDLNEYLNLPITKLSDLLWSLQNKRLEDLSLYKNFVEAFFKHKDFEYLPCDEIALNYSLLTWNSKIPGILELSTPIKNTLIDRLNQGKVWSTQEYINIFFHLSGLTTIDPEVIENLEKTILNRLLESDFNLVNLIRLVNVKKKLSDELVDLVHNYLLQNLNSLNINDLITILISYNSEQHQKIKVPVSDKLKKIHIGQFEISFQKLEKIITFGLNSNQIDPELWRIFENYITSIIHDPFISSHLLLKIIHWKYKVGIDSPEIEEFFLTKFLEKNRIPNYHSKDFTNFTSLVCILPFLQNDLIYSIIDEKLFLMSHHFEYYEISNCLANMAKINKIPITTQLILIKRLMDKEPFQIEHKDFSLACYSACLLNHIEFCQKSLTFVRLIMNFNELGNSIFMIGDLLKNSQKSFNATVDSVIRFAWMLTFLNVKDTRIFNAKLYQQLEEYPYDPYSFKIHISVDSNMDLTLYYLLIQVLAINWPERAKKSKFLQKICFELESNINNLSFYKTDSKASELYKDIAETAAILNFEVCLDTEFIYGNLINLGINGKKVFVYTKDHYIHDSKGYYTQNIYQDLLSTYKLRSKMLNSLGYKTIEIQEGEWINKTLDEKKQFLISLL